MEQVKSVFSFAKGFMVVFGFTSRHIDDISENLTANTDAEAIIEDWNKVGTDIKKSLSKYEKTQKLELDAC